ncbi:hypothetical protein BDQ17DRAFT_1335485 [Cyathus striatus]|nr:hypothetical protein BDQ17DRAFT_1335485 [Cyathus striatus]
MASGSHQISARNGVVVTNSRLEWTWCFLKEETVEGDDVGGAAEQRQQPLAQGKPTPTPAAPIPQSAVPAAEPAPPAPAPVEQPRGPTPPPCSTGCYACPCTGRRGVDY